MELTSEVKSSVEEEKAIKEQGEALVKDKLKSIWDEIEQEDGKLNIVIKDDAIEVEAEGFSEGLKQKISNLLNEE